MLVRLDFGCENDHITERVVPSGQSRIKCPECGKRAGVVWRATQGWHSHMKEAVLVFKMPDGSYSFPGSNQARTPKGAERLELRKAGEIRALMSDYNRREREKEDRKEDRFREVAERQQSERRAQLHHLMGQESDAAARDLYREALKRAELGGRTQYREAYWEAGE